MNTTQAAKQVQKAMIEAADAGRLYSEIDSKWVRQGYGVMSQRTLAERLAQRAAA